MIADKATKQAEIVDSVARDIVLEAVQNEGVTLTKVLTTYHHWDHAGGNKEFVEKFQNKLDVYDGYYRIAALTNQEKGGDKFKIGEIDVE